MLIIILMDSDTVNPVFSAGTSRFEAYPDMYAENYASPFCSFLRMNRKILDFYLIFCLRPRS